MDREKAEGREASVKEHTAKGTFCTVVIWRGIMGFQIKLNTFRKCYLKQPPHSGHDGALLPASCTGEGFEEEGDGDKRETNPALQCVNAVKPFNVWAMNLF